MADFLPRPEGALLAWLRNFDQQVNESPGALSLSIAQAAELRALFLAFAAAYRAATEPGTRTAAAVLLKDERKAAVVAYARRLGRIVQSAPEVDASQRFALGLRVRTEPRARRVPPPADAPGLSVHAIAGRNAVAVRVFDRTSPHRTAKARGAGSAGVFTHVGEDPPATAAGWAFRCQATRTTVEVTFPHTVPPGAKVWVTAQWYSPTGQPGPGATPAYARVAGGEAMAA